ncbi:hypothetical protein [Cryptosporidium parvum Iowa II]|uniref:Uncharacterized protein n=2 Tax=Cryptosporidium parvum TaxID=5807 RepID=Q5CVK4_CRYPI|nr:hypothetical protein [Cryptosporidium parvum Iowa II]EAK89529.1 conserved hypothetical protein [Cryptosporidium parvum Iowa II]QOY40140.1 Uncharacterized protein CPATCC_0003960 [Cryptosporidium parvum]WKS79635.1 hypothetical protein CPCDC_8g3730 [Cryptosporidium sp. 43IA8]WRK34138.1 Uncharacterized protein cpbgf_8003730 [Cryptosporidium parvum]|eukprot:QOY40140.1 hypothetical protein CPATCC_004226 [Cryptosporidium parvum]
MESIVNTINNISDKICCLNNYFLKDEEHKSNEVYQDVNDYYSFFNTKHNLINNDIFERSLFTSIGHGNEYLELSRNNKLFGSPVSLKSYVQKSKNQIKQHIFEHLEISKNDNPIKTGCHFNEPINYYKASEMERSVIIPRSKFVSHSSNPPINKDFNVQNSNKIKIPYEPNTSITRLKTNEAEKKSIKECQISKKNYLEIPTVNRLQVQSNPLLSKVNENQIQKTPSMPTIKQYKTASRCPEPIKLGNKGMNNENNKVFLTKYGGYLLGL